MRLVRVFWPDTFLFNQYIVTVCSVHRNVLGILQFRAWQVIFWQVRNVLLLPRSPLTIVATSAATWECVMGSTSTCGVVAVGRLTLSVVWHTWHVASSVKVEKWGPKLSPS